MKKKIVQVYYGTGKGKTTAAVGQCIRAASMGYSVIIIQFLKGNDAEEFCFLNKLEPEIKLFRFEKEKQCFRDLTESDQKEEKKNILNGVNFARKVLETGECDVLILDEILGLLELNIITIEDILNLITIRDDYFKLVMTGNHLPDQLLPYVEMVSEIVPKKGN